MVNSLNCTEDDFITTDHVGGGKSYESNTPILLKDSQYRFSIYIYEGNYFHDFHIDGRNSEFDDWNVICRGIERRDIVFNSDNDYYQVRVFWNKSATEQYVRIAYWLRPDNSVN